MRDDSSPTDAQRYPGLSPVGAELLRFMREHPQAPIYRNSSGHRLLPEELPAAMEFAARMQQAPVDPRADFSQSWLRDYASNALTQVPHYRRYGSLPEQLVDLPTISRGDLARDIAAFVPDDQPTERMINFRPTGLTGQPRLIASHPLVAARYLAFHQRALRRFGVELQSGPGDVGVMLVGWQQRCFTYVSVTPQRGECGLAKINLHEDDWRDPAHRGPYIDALKPEVITGDPLSLAALIGIDFGHRPRAILSTSMTLLAGLRAELEQRFGCPVLDLYSLNEAGPIAVHDLRDGVARPFGGDADHRQIHLLRQIGRNRHLLLGCPRQQILLHGSFQHITARIEPQTAPRKIAFSVEHHPPLRRDGKTQQFLLRIGLPGNDTAPHGIMRRCTRL